MATIKKEELRKELKLALKEIGKIQPWFEKDVDSWVFESQLYPVRYAGETAEEVIINYPKYLEVYIEHRMQGTIDEINHKNTKGRGGMRTGSGRPVGTKKDPTKQIRLPIDIADWIKYPGMIDHLRTMMQVYKLRISN